MVVAVVAGFLPHGVWRSFALRPTVPGDPEEQQQRGLLNQSVPGVTHSKHPAHFLLVRKRRRGTDDVIFSPPISPSFIFTL